jgi:hypothetical protein
MKLNRLMMASALCLTLSASPSAFACEHGNGLLFSFFHHCDSNRDSNNRASSNSSKRQCDQNGQDSGRGNNCDRGRGNGGGYCGTGGSTTGGGGSTSGGGASDPVYK